MEKDRQKIVDVELDMTGLAEYFGGFSYNNEIMMIRITDFNNEKISKAAEGVVAKQIRLDALTAVLVEAGNLDVSIDYNHYSVPEKSLLLISPSNSITGSNISIGGRFFLLMIKRDLLDRLADGPAPKPMLQGNSITYFQRPYFQLSNKAFENIDSTFELLYRYIRDGRENLKEFLIRPSLALVIMEMFSALSDENKIVIQDKPVSRGKELFSKFIFLVRDFGEKEHNPSFYAEKLFISVQYLSMITKQESGKTASELLAQHLATRARNLLRAPGSTIKNVAERLNFADQSSFGKFFKKETGFSPKKFIESL